MASVSAAASASAQCLASRGPAAARHQSSLPSAAPLSSSLAQCTLARKAGLKQSAFRGESFAQAAAIAVAPSRISMASDAFICADCGYIYNKRPAFEKLADDYRCPVCQAPKRRFKPYTAPVARNANDLAVRKARKEQLAAADSAIGNALPLLVGGIFVVLVALVIYLSSAY